MKKLYTLCLFIILVKLVALINISSANEERSDEYLLKENPFLPSTDCNEVKFIDGVKYCVHKSSITLNSCGSKSDWPCMDELGCLKIDKFTVN